jgi:endo-1,4-beta-xylanase
VRARSSEWNVNPAKIGVMGFSAGGEVAVMASTRYDAGNPNANVKVRNPIIKS